MKKRDSVSLNMAGGKDDVLWMQIKLSLKSSFDNISQCEVGKLTYFLSKIELKICALHCKGQKK